MCCPLRLQGYNEFSLLSLSCSDYLALPSVGIQIKNRLKDENVALSLPSQVGVRHDVGIRIQRPVGMCVWWRRSCRLPAVAYCLPACHAPSSGVCLVPPAAATCRSWHAVRHAVPDLPAVQRVDRFDDDIANIVTNSAKRSGLTFAPEAGTQASRMAVAVGRRRRRRRRPGGGGGGGAAAHSPVRPRSCSACPTQLTNKGPLWLPVSPQRLRDIINKGLTNEELLRGVKTAWDKGWRQIKLYFMIGGRAGRPAGCMRCLAALLARRCRTTGRWRRACQACCAAARNALPHSEALHGGHQPCATPCPCAGLPGETDADVMGIAETVEWLQRECRQGKWHLAVNVTIR